MNASFAFLRGHIRTLFALRDASHGGVPQTGANATGHAVVEAPLLKERIEWVYDDLSKRARLGSEQKTTLRMPHIYIAPKRPDWL
jgi:hypothetical protein